MAEPAHVMGEDFDCGHCLECGETITFEGSHYTFDGRVCDWCKNELDKDEDECLTD